MRHLKIWDILSGAEDNYIPPHLLISPYNADVRFSTDFFSSRVSVKRTKPSLILLQPQINSEKKWHRQASNTPDPKIQGYPREENGNRLKTHMLDAPCYLGCSSSWTCEWKDSILLILIKKEQKQWQIQHKFGTILAKL